MDERMIKTSAESVIRCWSNGCKASDQGKQQRRNLSSAKILEPTKGDKLPAREADALTQIWAIVPLNPNELTPSLTFGVTRPIRCVGNNNGDSERPNHREGRSPFNERNCAFPCASLDSRDREVATSPRWPAHGSEWPMFALLDPTLLRAFGASPSAWLSAETSVGSPSAVPVP